MSALLSALGFILLYLFGVFCILVVVFTLCGIYICFPGGENYGDEEIVDGSPERVQKMET